MGKCSYTWAEWSQKKGELIKNQCTEEIWEGSERFCIFHDPSEKKDAEQFKQQIQKKFETKDYNFRGYHFPDDMSFSYREFGDVTSFIDATFKNVSFVGARFRYVSFNKAKFDEACFNGARYLYSTFDGAKFMNSTFVGAIFHYASFIGATFKDVSFDGATFQKGAYFKRTTFRDVSFMGTTFKEVSFGGAVIERNLDFNPRQVTQLDFQNAKFLFKGHITADLTNSKFDGADLENVAFIECKWPERLYEEAHMEDEPLSYGALEGIYRNLRQNMQRHGEYVMEGKFSYREMEMRRKGAKKKKNRLWLELYRLLAGYGERPVNTIGVSGFVVLAFALLYTALDCLEFPIGNLPLSQRIIDDLYFSFVTFATLGAGNINPINEVGKVLICTEAMIGAFLIALFVVVFVRKMAR